MKSTISGLRAHMLVAQPYLQRGQRLLVQPAPEHLHNGFMSSTVPSRGFVPFLPCKAVRDYASSDQQQDPRIKRFWTADSMPSQDGKVFVVTGASSGLGYHAAESIAKKGGHVIIATHNLDRAQQAAQSMRDAGAKGKVEATFLDLASFESVVNFAEAYKKRNIPLHVLVENGGTFLCPFDRTQEGFETTVGTNYFGHFLLRHLLIDKLKETAKEFGGARIVAMASLFEILGNVHFSDLEGYRSRESGIFEYSNSKIMIIMAAREMNKRLKGSGVEIFLSQPGLVQTELNDWKLDHNKLTANLIDVAANVYGQSAERASLCLQRPATDPNVTGWGGSYFSPPWLWLAALQFDNAGMQEPSNKLARDQVAWVQLYRKTLDIVNKKLEDKDLQNRISSI